MNQYLIGDILVQMDYGGMAVLPGDNMSLFRYDGPWNGDSVQFRGQFEPLDGYRTNMLRGDNRVYEIYRHENEDLLVYHWGNQYYGFGIWPDRFQVSYSPVMKNQPALREDWFFSVCAFHKQLLLREGLILHSSYVDIGGEAILFTGPSDMGKSTQADLWKRHAGARIINGDRTVIRRHGGVWHAFGYPCCGTSGICINETLPLRAIVVLAQAPENRIEELPASRKIRALASATELYPWNQEEIGMAFQIAQMISADVPVIRLHCRPDAGAVTAVKDYLEGTNHAGI